MDDEVRKVSDRNEQEVLPPSTTEQATAVAAGFLVPRETPTGVQYVRARGRRPWRSAGCFSIGVLVILSAASVAAGILLVTNPAAAAGWQLALGCLYPLQLLLD